MKNLPIKSSCVIFGGVGIALWLSQYAWIKTTIV